MFKFKKPLKIKVLPGETLTVVYNSKERTPIFDLCDYNGKLVETGKLKSTRTCLDIKKLNGGIYYLFILDGPKILTEKFAV